MKLKVMFIAVDFDGTVVSFDYPRIGKDIGAVPVLKALVEKGHQIILLTMRSGQELVDAVEWFEENEIPLYDVNRNKSQYKWTSSRKVHADLYIDDQALGAPVLPDPMGKKPYINWSRVSEILKQKGLL